MAEADQTDQTTDTETTKSSESAIPVTAKPSPKVSHLHRGWFIVAVLLLSLAFGFFGGWLAFESFANQSNQQLASSPQTLIIKEGEAISEVAERVDPSVVSIVVESSSANSFFFGAVEQESAGTGIILTENGRIVTNRHVIDGNVSNIKVVTSDGTEYDDVEIIDKDPFNDIAFLQINGASGLTPAELGDSDDVKVGQRVIAIGNALGRFDNTVTSGIISGLSRPVLAGGASDDIPDNLENLLQTDAAINPGNSGGPLVSIDGKVVGINTAVAGGAENIGFAIPINDVKQGITSVEENGRIIKPYLGVRFVTVNPVLAAELNLPVEEGALIDLENPATAILSGSPAEKASLQSGDIIIKVGDTDINSSHSLSRTITQFQVGDVTTVTFLRDGQEQTVEVTLEEAPDSL